MSELLKQVLPGNYVHFVDLVDDGLVDEELFFLVGQNFLSGCRWPNECLLDSRSDARHTRRGPLPSFLNIVIFLQ